MDIIYNEIKRMERGIIDKVLSQLLQREVTELDRVNCRKRQDPGHWGIPQLVISFEPAAMFNGKPTIP